MALPKRNKAKAAFGAALVAGGALLTFGTATASANAIVSMNDLTVNTNRDGNHYRPWDVHDTSVTKSVCIDRGQMRECATATYPLPAPANPDDVLPRYNPATDHLDTPPQGTPGYDHWQVPLRFQRLP